MNSQSIGSIGQILTLIKPSGKALSLPLEGVARAEVVRIIRDDEAIIRIENENIRVKTEVPLSKGDVIMLKFLGFDKDVRLQLLDIVSKDVAVPEGSGKNQPSGDLSAFQAKILKALTALSDTRSSCRDVMVLSNLCRSLPSELLEQFPELQALEKALPEIADLSFAELKAAFENSGVLFETKLRIAAEDTGEEPDHVAFKREGQEGLHAGKVPLQAEGKGLSTMMKKEIAADIKGLLLKARQIFNDARAVESMKLSGLKPEQMRETIERLLRNIDFFQITSRVNDMLYAYLPVSWQELKDGELIFKRSRDDRRAVATYYCTINLDLAYTGKMAVSLTMQERSLYVSFKVERKESCDLLRSHKDILEKKCADAGISLRAVNFSTEPVVFGKPRAEGLHIRV
jgi:Flagellar hook-length control protein FliK